MHLSTEFLLKLPHKSDMDLSVSLSQPVGDMDHHSLAVPRYINLAAKYRNNNPP